MDSSSQKEEVQCEFSPCFMAHRWQSQTYKVVKLVKKLSSVGEWEYWPMVTLCKAFCQLNCDSYNNTCVYWYYLPTLEVYSLKTNCCDSIYLQVPWNLRLVYVLRSYLCIKLYLQKSCYGVLWYRHSHEPIKLEAVWELMHPMAQQGGKMMLVNRLH